METLRVICFLRTDVYFLLKLVVLCLPCALFFFFSFLAESSDKPDILEVSEEEVSLTNSL